MLACLLTLFFRPVPAILIHPSTSIQSPDSCSIHLFSSPYCCNTPPYTTILIGHTHIIPSTVLVSFQLSYFHFTPLRLSTASLLLSWNTSLLTIFLRATLFANIQSLTKQTTDRLHRDYFDYVHKQRHTGRNIRLIALHIKCTESKQDWPIISRIRTTTTCWASG